MSATITIYSIDGRIFTVSINDSDTIQQIKYKFSQQYYITLDDCDLYTYEYNQCLLPDTYTLSQYNLSIHNLILVAKLKQPIAHPVYVIPLTPSHSLHSVTSVQRSDSGISVASSTDIHSSTSASQQHNIFDQVEISLSREHSKQRIANMLTNNTHNSRIQHVRDKLKKSMTAPLNQLNSTEMKELAAQYDTCDSTSMNHCSTRAHLTINTPYSPSYQSTTHSQSICHTPHSISHLPSSSGQCTPLPRQSSTSTNIHINTNNNNSNNNILKHYQQYTVDELTEQYTSIQNDVLLLSQRTLAERNSMNEQITALLQQIQLAQSDSITQQALLRHQRNELHTQLHEVQQELKSETELQQQIQLQHDQQCNELNQQLCNVKLKLVSLESQRDQTRLLNDKLINDIRVQLGATSVQNDIVRHTTDNNKQYTIDSIVTLIQNSDLCDSITSKLQSASNDKSMRGVTDELLHTSITG